MAVLNALCAIHDSIVVVLWMMTQSKCAETPPDILEGDFGSDGHRAQRFQPFERDIDRLSIRDASDVAHTWSIPHPVKTSRAGRPPAGANGEKTSVYPQISARLPPEMLVKVRELSRALRVPQCRIIADALDAYLKRHAPTGGEPHQAGETPRPRGENQAAPFWSDIAANVPSEQKR